MADPLCGVGRNYLEQCEGLASPESRSVAEGIRRVLRGQADKFEFEYPCHSPTEQRWFLALVTPLGSAPGAVVMHIDVTIHHFAPELLLGLGRGQRKLARILESQTLQLREAQAAARLGSWEADLVRSEVICSDQLYCLLETTHELLQPTFPAIVEWVHPDDRAAVRESCLSSIDKGGPYSMKHRLLLPGGRIKLVEQRWQVFRREGMLVQARGTCREIGEP